ncbi:hypothetical protein [Streptomyces huasconensis]|uniref:hypothetical protein n=1 Tax=Streptomyces huasconensis TaxID=1854574 RepID=UPI0033DA24EE
MSPIVPSLPLHLVQLGFDYVLAVEAGDDATAARLAPEVAQLPGLLPAIAELVVLPVIALSDDTDACADSFVLDEVGVLYLMAIREWAAPIPRGGRAGDRPHHRALRRPGPRQYADRRRPHSAGAARRTGGAGPRGGGERGGSAPLTAAAPGGCAPVRWSAPTRCALVRWCAHPVRTEPIRCAPRCAPTSIRCAPLGGRCAHRCGRCAGVVRTGWTVVR